MNSTNRALNRTFIFLVGLLLLATGAAATAVALVASVTDGWKTTAPDVSASVSSALVDTPLGDTGHSWLWIVLIAVLLIVVLLLVLFVTRQGRGHTRRLLTPPPTDNGSTVLDAAVAEQVLQESLTGRPELLSSHVSTYKVRGASVLKVTVTCRRGVSPIDVTRIVESRIAALEQLLGTDVPALIQISGGFRTRVTKSTRLA
jgi:hypothetical protein